MVQGSYNILQILLIDVYMSLNFLKIMETGAILDCHFELENTEA